MRAEELTAKFGIAGVLDFVETEHGLVKAAISLDGVTAELYLQGAQVTAWRPSNERPVLFTSPNSTFTPGRAIRGGIPIVFPWFGASRHTPTGPQHGFARTATWHLDAVETAGGGSLTLTLSLGDGDVGSPLWPERFRAIYSVTFAQTLSLRLAVQNRTTHPIVFEEALHSYFAISDIAPIAISGLAGIRRQDRPSPPQAADRGSRHHHDGDRPGLPRYTAAMRRRRSRVAPPHRHREGRSCVERGVEPLGRKSGRDGRSRRARLARHGMRRGREYRRQRGSARRRC
jgi:aldose 1-epimerase